jgi:hypothetical protein
MIAEVFLLSALAAKPEFFNQKNPDPIKVEIIHEAERQTMAQWYAGLLGMHVDYEGGHRILFLGDYRPTHAGIAYVFQMSAFPTFGFTSVVIKSLENYCQGIYEGMPFREEAFHIVHNFGDLFPPKPTDYGHLFLHLREVFRIIKPGGFFVTRGTPDFLDSVEAAGFSQVIFKSGYLIKSWVEIIGQDPFVFVKPTEDVKIVRRSA